MATIAKITLPSGAVRYRAIVKSGGRQVASKNFDTRTNARTWARHMEGDAERLKAMGLPGASKIFAEAAETMLANTTGKDIHRHSRVNWWVERIGTMPLARIETADLRKHLDEYAKTHQPASANRLKASASSVYRYAMREGWWTTNPARALAHRTENNEVTRWLSDDERVRLLAACEASTWPKLRAMVLVLLGTGCRLGEAQRLRWSDLDWEARTARLETTKNGQPRVLSFPTPVMSELRKHRQVGNALVFAGDNPSRPFTLRKAWLRALKDAGISNLRIHDLRHSCASYLVMSGATLHEVAEVLGHRSIQTTKRYAHLSTGHKQALTDRVLGGLL